MRTIDEILAEVEFNHATCIKQYAVLRKELTELTAKPPTPRELHLEEMRAAFKLGEVVECMYSDRTWHNVNGFDSIVNGSYEYRVKPVEKPDIVISTNVSLLKLQDKFVVGFLADQPINMAFTFTADGKFKGCRSL